MPDDTLRNQIVTNYWPIKGGRDVGVEGSSNTSRPGPGGRGNTVSTLEDFRTGKSSYVTIAADPSHYGKWYTIPSYSYVNAAGEKHTLQNVPAYVHDTGSAFTGRPRKFDIAADYSTGDRHGARLDRLNADLNRGTVFTPGANAHQIASAYSGPRLGTQRYWEQGRAAPTQVASGAFNIAKVDRMLSGAGTFEGGKPTGMIIHHTSGHEKSAQAVADELGAKGLGVQFVIDRGPDGTGKNPQVWQITPEGRTAHHFKDGWGPMGAGRSYKNTEGVEIIADPTGESGPKTPVTPEQQALAGQLVGARSSKFGWDPQKNVFGHGEVNPGHREAAEGMEVVSRLRAGTLPLGGKTQVASAGPKPLSTAFFNQGKVEGGAPSIEVAKVSGAGPNAKIAEIGAAKVSGGGSNATVSASGDAVHVHQGEAGKTNTPIQGQAKPQEVAQGGPNAQATGAPPTKVAEAGSNAKVGSTDDNAKVASAKESGAQVHEAGANAAVSEKKRAQLADGGPRTGTDAYWRGPPSKHAQAAHIAGDGAPAASDGSARSHVPHSPGGGHGSPDGDGTAHAVAASSTGSNEPWAPEVTGVSFEGGAGGVPARVVIDITVHATPV